MLNHMSVYSALEQNVKNEFARAKFSLYGSGKYIHKKVKSNHSCLKVQIWKRLALRRKDFVVAIDTNGKTTR